MIPSQAVIVPTPYCFKLYQRNNKFQFDYFGLHLPGFETTIFPTQGGYASHYTTDVRPPGEHAKHYTTNVVLFA